MVIPREDSWEMEMEKENHIKVERSGSTAYQCAIAETRGVRPCYEDRHVATCEKNVAEVWLLDGHRGAEAADFVAEALPKRFESAVRGGKLPSDEQVRHTFRTVDNQLRAHIEKSLGKNSKRQPGSTAVGVFAAQQVDGLYSAKIVNCGDSRAVVIQATEEHGCKPKVLLETKDHKPGNKEEQKRIKLAGGSVAGTKKCPRIDGKLSVSRGLGDFDFKADKKRSSDEQKVSCMPDVFGVTGLQPGTFILLACDGVWDVLDSQAAAAFVQRKLKHDAQADLAYIAASLVQRCLRLGSMDNLTVTLLRLADAEPWLARLEENLTPPREELGKHEDSDGDDSTRGSDSSEENNI